MKVENPTGITMKVMWNGSRIYVRPGEIMTVNDELGQSLKYSGCFEIKDTVLNQELESEDENEQEEE